MQQVLGTKETLHAKLGVVLIVGLAPYKGMLKSSRHLGIFVRNFKPVRNAALHVLGVEEAKNLNSTFHPAQCERNPSRHMAKL